MRRKSKKRAGTSGVSLVMVTMCIFVLFGMAGLAIDAGQMYVTKQKAQAAADAGAQAGIMDLYRGLGLAQAKTSATDYAERDGFASAEISISTPDCSSLTWCNGHVTLSGTDNPNLFQVKITRQVNTTFMRALSVDAGTVSATATGAISLQPSPIPILVLHPTLSGSFSKNGSNTITICGGPQRSIQVNSSSATSVSISGASGHVDLSHAGPLDDGTCSSGTGADFANVGLQSEAAAFPSGYLLLGTAPGHYVYPASVLKDPLLGVAAPAQPAAAPGPTVVCGGGSPFRCPVAQHNCPASLPNGSTCEIFSPGYYPNGIIVPNKTFAQFKSGVYWINHGGFQLGDNTIARMALAADDSLPAGWTCPVSGVACMLVYNSPSTPVSAKNDIFSITANSGQINNTIYPDNVACGGTVANPNGGNCLVGAPTGATSTYEGILFFQSHGTATSLTHQILGGSQLNVTGTMYFSHTAASIASDSTYQTVALGGNGGGNTKVQGEIITDALSLSGSSQITMNLISQPTFQVRQVALVQ